MIVDILDGRAKVEPHSLADGHAGETKGYSNTEGVL